MPIRLLKGELKLRWVVELRVINAKTGVRKEVIFLCFNFLLLSKLHNSIA